MKLGWLHKAEETLFLLLLVAMVLLVFVEVVLRFVFNTGISWSQEATLYLAGWFVLIGVSWGVKQGAHIGVDVVVKMLPLIWQRVATLAALVICMAYCVMLLVGSYEYLSLMQMIGIELEDIAIPKWYALTILPIAMLLLMLRFAVLGWKVIRGDASGFGFHDEGEDSMHLVQPADSVIGDSSDGAGGKRDSDQEPRR
ncbi:TRAP transporter small permease [Cobetia sp. 5-11-6-3]|uniref:TRAP transporter small permease n=1 Tax=Cobetia sp. 5-11-6-3 TaxID=2737458 RepID=UPI00159670A8|nr:TRAP transporter small permease [Cobetia sp. 5-11-6-3]